jgi:RND family efflux transporter MFP subunit
MKNYKRNTFTIILIIISLFLTQCGKSDADKENTENEKKTVSVEVETVKGENYISYIKVIGVVKPLNQAKLSFLEGGKIKKFLKSKGSYVRKGDTIVVLDNAIAKANIQAAKAKYDFAEINFEKQNTIYKDNVNSEFQFLKAKSDRDQAKASYELMKSRFENTIIIAPFNGIIDAKFMEVGEFAPPGSPVINLIQSSIIKIEAGVPERFSTNVKRNQKVLIKITEAGKELHTGKISYVGSSLNINNRTFPIEIILKNYNGNIKPEMMAEVSIEKRVYENVVTIPDDVVTRTDNGYVVFVVENGIAKRRIVKFIDRFDNKIAIEDGLNSGDNLIVVGFQNLVNGQEVNVVE